ncbi:hypothetical protein CDAR_263921, partial [Caerostris darwini]
MTHKSRRRKYVQLSPLKSHGSSYSLTNAICLIAVRRLSAGASAPVWVAS